MVLVKKDCDFIRNVDSVLVLPDYFCVSFNRRNNGVDLSSYDIKFLKNFDRYYLRDKKKLLRKLIHDKDFVEFYTDIKDIGLNIDIISYFDGVFEVWAIENSDTVMSLNEFKDIINYMKKTGMSCSYNCGEMTFCINKSAAPSLTGKKLSFFNLHQNFVFFCEDKNDGILFDDLLPYVDYIDKIYYQHGDSDRDINVYFKNKYAGLFSKFGDYYPFLDNNLCVKINFDDKKVLLSK